MNSDWYKGAKDKEERKRLVNTSKQILDVLKEIVETRLDDLQRTRRDPKHFESPSWAMLQADFNARERELEYLLTLLDQEEK